MNNFVFFREPEECELHFTLETSNSPGSSLSTTPTPVTGMLAIEGSELITANSTIDKGKILVGSASVARRLIYNSSSPTIRVQGVKQPRHHHQNLSFHPLAQLSAY